MSEVGFDGIEALRSRAIMNVKAPASDLEKMLCDYRKHFWQNWQRTMSGMGLSGIEAHRSRMRVLMDVRSQKFWKLVRWLILNTCTRTEGI